MDNKCNQESDFLRTSDLPKRGRASRPSLSIRGCRTSHGPAKPRAPTASCSRPRPGTSAAPASSRRGRGRGHRRHCPPPPPPSLAPSPTPHLAIEPPKDELPEAPPGFFGEDPFDAAGPFYGFSEEPLARCRELREIFAKTIACVEEQVQLKLLKDSECSDGKSGSQKAKNTPVRKLNRWSDSELQLVYPVDDIGVGARTQKKCEETTSPRSLRIRKPINYREQLYNEDGDNSEELSCDECGFAWPGECVAHGPLTPVENARVPAALAARASAETRAALTAPPQLAVAASAIPHAGRGVWARVALAARLRLGPYAGRLLRRAATPDYSWQVWVGRRLRYVDAGDCRHANWLRFVNCARNVLEQNLAAFQWRGAIYYRTKRAIPAHEELLVWYGDKFGERLGISLEAFATPLAHPVPYNKFSCDICKISFRSPLGLQEHLCNFDDQESMHKSNRLSADSFTRQRDSYGSNDEHEEILNLNFLLLASREDENVCKNTVELQSSTKDVNQDFMEQEENEIEEYCSQTADRSEKPNFSYDVKNIREKTEENLNNQAFQVHQVSFSDLNTEENMSKANETNDKLNDCEFCKVNFKSSTMLKRHITTIHNGKPYKCTLCKATFKRNAFLKKHALVHSTEKPYHCDKCDRSYKELQSLKRHWNNNHKEIYNNIDASLGYLENKSLHNTKKSPQKNISRAGIFVNNRIKPTFNCTSRKQITCKKCNAVFTTFASLTVHNYVHSPKGSYKCPICGAKFKYLSSLRFHFSTHDVEKNGDKFYRCYVCNDECESAESLKVHILKHKTAKIYRCQTCEATFKTPHGLVWHSYRHTGERPYQCPKCAAAFDRPRLLSRHKLIHSDEKSLICDVCKAPFVTVSGLKKHMVIHQGDNLYRCEVCNATFTKSWSLKIHMYYRHTSNKPHKCEICNAIFVYKWSLKRHSFTHSERKTQSSQVQKTEKKFQCHVCDKVFKRKSTYETHQVTHTGERPYECDLCKKAFTLKATYAKHIKLHTAKPHQCAECGKSFETEDRRKAHMRIHTVERSYSCDVCRKSYCHKSSLNVHRRIHTEQPLNKTGAKMFTSSIKHQRRATL